MAQLSKTKMKVRSKKKTHPVLKEIIHEAMKHPAWHPLVQKLSGPTRRFVSINLENLDALAKDGETLIVPGSILSLGTFNKKCIIIPLRLTQSAKEKLAESKIEVVDMLEFIKKNVSAKGVRIIWVTPDQKKTLNQL